MAAGKSGSSDTLLPPTGYGWKAVIPIWSVRTGDTDYQARHRFKLPVDMEVANIWSHLHTIGKTVRVTAELPNGERRKLLSIQDWDFNWQDTYLYQKPFWLPKGTIVRAEWS